MGSSEGKAGERPSTVLPPHLLPHSRSQPGPAWRMTCSALNSRESEPTLLSCLFDNSRVSDNSLWLRTTKTAEFGSFVIVSPVKTANTGFTLQHNYSSQFSTVASVTGEHYRHVYISDLSDLANVISLDGAVLHTHFILLFNMWVRKTHSPT